MSGNLGYVCGSCSLATLDDQTASKHETETGHTMTSEVWR